MSRHTVIRLPQRSVTTIVRGTKLLLLFACLLLSCSEARPRPDVLLITVDTLRADRLGCYGHDAAVTPNIDALAATGVRFSQCQSVAPITLTSHASILSGLTPPEHGARNNSSYRIDPSVPTLATRLKSAGFATGAFVAALPLAARTGLDRGFDVYDDELPTAARVGFHLPERSGEEVVDSALAWARGQSREEALFAWVHLFEPHRPFESGSYDGEVAAADQAIGRLLREFERVRGRAPLVVFTSDHGEGLGEHGESSHTLFLFQTTLHVPLIFHGPGVAVGVVDEAVSVVDIASTVLARFGLSGLHGRDLLAPLTRKSLYSETLYPWEGYGWSPSFALRRGTRKVIRSAKPAAFDLANDPNEMENLWLVDPPPEWARTLVSELDRTVSEQRAVVMDAAGQPSAAERDAMAALGYVGMAAQASLEGTRYLELMAERPDATEELDLFARLMWAEELHREGEDELAMQELESILERNSDNTLAWIVRAESHVRRGEAQLAVAAYEQADQLWPGRFEVQVALARLHRDAGREEDAASYYAQAVTLDPRGKILLEASEYDELRGNPSAAANLWRTVLADAGAGGLNHARAEEALARIARSTPQQRADHAVVLRARQLNRQSRWEEMGSLLREEEIRGNGAALLYRGVALHMLRDVSGAVAEYRRALAIDPTLHLAHNNLAWALASLRVDLDVALAHAKSAVELFGEEPEYHDTYVEVLLQSGRGDEAKKYAVSTAHRFPANRALRKRVAGGP